MTRIVTIDYELVGNTAAPALFNLLDGGELANAVLSGLRVDAITIQNTRTAQSFRRGLFAFEIDQSVSISTVLGSIHTAVTNSLGPRTQMQLPLASDAIRITVSGSTHGSSPEIWSWDGVKNKMINVF